MESQSNRNAVRSFAAAFASTLSEAVGQALGTPWPLEALDAQEPATRKGQPIQIRLKADGALRGEAYVEFYEPRASELVAKLSEGDPAGAADPGKALSAVIAAAAERMQESLAAQFGQVSFKVESATGLAFGGMYVVPLAVRADGAGDSLLLYFNGELLDALSSASLANGASTESGERGIHPSNLKLVMDVELNVSLRFGQRQLPLREVLELGSGSVIELDRMVDEPVELLLDGKLVARGEAVIVDGNYGLRVTEIPQAMESHFLR